MSSTGQDHCLSIARVERAGKCLHTAVGDAYSIRGAEEILRQWRYLSAIANGDWAVISMSVVVARLLIVFELVL